MSEQVSFEALVSALEKHAEQHAMMAKMARRVEAGSLVNQVDPDTGKSKRVKFATVVRCEAEASEKHARALLSRIRGEDGA